MPQPPVEDERVAGRREHGLGARGRVEAELRTVGAGEGVALVAARDDQHVPAARDRHVREPEGHLERHPRARIAVELEVLAPSVLVPSPRGRTARLRARRGYVEVAVVEVDVPAQLAPDLTEHGRMVEQVEEEVVAPDPAEQVHRLAGPDVAAGHLLAVDPAERGGQALDRRRLQRTGDGQEAVGAKRWRRSGEHDRLDYAWQAVSESLNRTRDGRAARSARAPRRRSARGARP